VVLSVLGVVKVGSACHFFRRDQMAVKNIYLALPVRVVQQMQHLPFFCI
jgi:hypothetical protein